MLTKLLYLIFKPKYKSKVININGKGIKCYIADTFMKKMFGLMYWENLNSNEGMLFIVRRPSRPGIWMLDMKFPIDIIWLDKEERVVDIAQKVEPCRSIFNCKVYYPNKDSSYVLELAAGAAKKLKIVRGIKIAIGV